MSPWRCNVTLVPRFPLSGPGPNVPGVTSALALEGNYNAASGATERACASVWDRLRPDVVSRELMPLRGGSRMKGVAPSHGHIVQLPVTMRALLPTVIPRVSLLKAAQQFAGDPARDPLGEVEIQARIEHNLRARTSGRLRRRGHGPARLPD